MPHYRATFADGRSIERPFSKKEYTHGWRWSGLNKGVPTHAGGFSSSKTLAESAARTESNYHARTFGTTIERIEVVPVEVIGGNR